MKFNNYSIIILSFILFISSIIVFNGITKSFASETSIEPYIFLTEWGSQGNESGQFGGQPFFYSQWFKLTEKFFDNFKKQD